VELLISEYRWQNNFISSMSLLTAVQCSHMTGSDVVLTQST